MAEAEGGIPVRYSNSWCELSMIDDGETGQFTNCYWEYLSSLPSLPTNNPGPRQTRYLHSQQKLSPPRKVLQSGWWSEGGRDSEEIKDVFMQKTEIWKIWNNLLLHIFLKEKQGKTCFLGSEHVLLVSDFNQNRFDRFISEGISHIPLSQIPSSTIRSRSR